MSVSINADESEVAEFAPQRRTQQERREATRRRLLDAAVEELIQTGYVKFRTAEVCRRAELSQGALFKHFATKAELVGATARHLFSLLLQDYQKLFAEAAADDDPIGTSLTLLWKTFNGPLAKASVELLAAARADAELAAALAPVIAEHRANLRTAARELFPALAKRPNFDAHARMLHDAMHGAILWTLVMPDAAAEDMVSYLSVLTRWITLRPE
jgi:AcrR family transcriptional regulator